MRKEWVMYAGIAAVLGIIWMLNGSMPFTKTFPQPKKAPPTDPAVFTDQVTIPVVFPARSGHEITVLIENGLAPLWKPRPNLFTWMECPPSEADDA
jgi:hypothetical protein